MSSLLTPGRVVLVLGNLSYSIGAFVADWSVTHVLNPRWPPHAKFHNGQTMSLGVLLALTSIYFAFRPALSNTPVSAADERRSVLEAALVGSFYCGAGLSAILYPGTAWLDPEFGEGAPQMWLFTGIVGFMWVGYALEMNRLSSAKGKAA